MIECHKKQSSPHHIKDRLTCFVFFTLFSSFLIIFISVCSGESMLIQKHKRKLTLVDVLKWNGERRTKSTLRETNSSSPPPAQFATENKSKRVLWRRNSFFRFLSILAVVKHRLFADTPRKSRSFSQRSVGRNVTFEEVKKNYYLNIIYNAHFQVWIFILGVC